jgi:WD40 repeat protein
MNDPDWRKSFGELMNVVENKADEVKPGQQALVPSADEYETRIALEAELDSRRLLCFQEMPLREGDSVPPSYELLNAALPDSSFKRYVYMDKMSRRMQNEEFREYMDEMEKDFRNALKRSLGNTHAQRNEWISHGCGLGVPGIDADEMLIHANHAGKLATEYVSRGFLMEQCLYFLNDTSFGNAFTDDSYKGINLSIVAPEGYGKSLLMAKLADYMYKNKEEYEVSCVISRFCGLTQRSTTGLEVVRSICQQILYAQHRYNELYIVSNNYRDCVELLRQLLKESPIALFIDGVDAIKDDYRVRSELNFLRYLQPHEKTRVIVSCASDSDPCAMYRFADVLTTTEVPAEYEYDDMSDDHYHQGKRGPDTCLDEAAVPRLTIPEFGAWSMLDREDSSNPHSLSQSAAPSQQDFSRKTSMKAISRAESGKVDDNGDTSALGTMKGEKSLQSMKFVLDGVREDDDINDPEMKENPREIIEVMLRQLGRTLTHKQWIAVEKAATVDLTPLNFRLIVRAVSKWTNETTPDVVGGVKDYMDKLLNDAEKELGYAFVRAAVGFITFSVHGVQECEIGDLTSLHVGQDFTENPMSPSPEEEKEKEVPNWRTLSHNLDELILYSEEECIVWFHPKIRHVVSARYSKEEIQSLHRTMGMYFGNILSEDVAGEMQVMEQPLVLNRKIDCFDTNEEGIEENGATDIHFDEKLPGSGDDQVSEESIDTVSLWAPGALINRRRWMESAWHLVSAGMFTEATAELCSIENICAATKCGYGNAVVQNLLRLLKSEGRSPRAFHYYRWLTSSMKVIVTDPTLEVIQTASLQPLCSEVRADVASVVGAYSPKGLPSTSQWVRCYAMGGKLQFEAGLGVVKGHGRDVSAVEWHNETIVSASWDGGVRIWNANSRRVQHTCSEHNALVTCIAMSPDGSQLASGAWDNKIRIWDTATGNELMVLEGHRDYVCTVDWSFDGRYIVSGGYDYDVIVWDTESGTNIHTFAEHANWVTSVCCSPKDTRIASAGYDQTIMIWSVADFKKELNLVEDCGAILTISWSPDGSKLASAGHDRKVHVWNAYTYSLLFLVEDIHVMIYTVSWSPDSEFIAMGCADKTVKICSIETEKISHTLDGHDDNVMSVSWSTDGSRLVSGSADSTLRIWDATSFTNLVPIEGHREEVTCVDWIPGTCQLVSASKDGTVYMWDAKLGRAVRVLETHQEIVYSVKASPDARYVATCSKDTKLILWDRNTGEICKTLEEHSEALCCLSWAPDSSKLAVGSVFKSIRIWDRASGSLIGCVEGAHDACVMALDWSACGKFIASGCTDGAVKVWTVGKKMKISLNKRLKDHSGPITQVKWGPDSKRLLSCAQESCMHIWYLDAEDSMVVSDVHDQSVNTACWALDNTHVVSASSNGVICIWNASTYAIVWRESTVGALAIRSLVVGADRIGKQGEVGVYVGAGYTDGSVRVWDSIAL